MMKQIAQPLNKNQLPFESLDAIPIPIVLSESIVNVEGEVRVHRYINKAFIDEIGYDIEQMPDTKTWFSLAYPDEHYRNEIINGWNKEIEVCEAKGSNLVKMTALVRCKSGLDKWFNVVANIHTTHLHFVTFIDIHELKLTLEENERLSLIDPLTNLANRRKALSFLEHCFGVYQRTASIFSVVICDIDYFKSINDEHGHACGDAVLREIAKALNAACRIGDCVARWGGEEFLIILPFTDINATLAFAERFRVKIQNLSFESEHGEFNVTMSFGCATIAGGDTIESLLNKADIALYQAKENGRNLVLG